MYFSGKISNSIISFLDKAGVDLDAIYELTDLSLEFVRDPSSWLEAKKLEEFMHQLELKFSSLVDDESFYTKIGSNCYELKSWGVLDSVLRMVQRPEDIYSQPQRFISYFVSPAPPIGNVQKLDDGIGFELPISSQEFPHVSEYLTAALSSLPLFVGKPSAQVSWQQTQIQITWNKKQADLLEDVDLRPHHSPELVQSLIHNFEALQKQNDKLKKDLTKVTEENYQLKAELDLLLQSPRNVDTLAEKKGVYFKPHQLQPIEQLRSHFLKMNDYFSRASQLIVLLVGQGRKDKQVNKAMKKVNWDLVHDNQKQISEEFLTDLDQLSASLSGLLPKTKTTVNKEQQPVPETISMDI